MPDNYPTKASGILIVTDFDGRTTEAETQRCTHCQSTWVFKKGSGITRGFCTKCMGVTCGRPECQPCEHWEKKLERIEKAARQ